MQTRFFGQQNALERIFDGDAATPAASFLTGEPGAWLDWSQSQEEVASAFSWYQPNSSSKGDKRWVGTGQYKMIIMSAGPPESAAHLWSMQVPSDPLDRDEGKRGAGPGARRQQQRGRGDERSAQVSAAPDWGAAFHDRRAWHEDVYISSVTRRWARLALEFALQLAAEREASGTEGLLGSGPGVGGEGGEEGEGPCQELERRVLGLFPAEDASVQKPRGELWRLAQPHDDASKDRSYFLAGCAAAMRLFRAATVAASAGGDAGLASFAASAQGGQAPLAAPERDALMEALQAMASAALGRAPDDAVVGGGGALATEGSAAAVAAARTDLAEAKRELTRLKAGKASEAAIGKARRRWRSARKVKQALEVGDAAALGEEAASVAVQQPAAAPDTAAPAVPSPDERAATPSGRRTLGATADTARRVRPTGDARFHAGSGVPRLGCTWPYRKGARQEEEPVQEEPEQQQQQQSRGATEGGASRRRPSTPPSGSFVYAGSRVR